MRQQDADITIPESRNLYGKGIRQPVILNLKTLSTGRKFKHWGRLFQLTASFMVNLKFRAIKFKYLHGFYRSLSHEIIAEASTSISRSKDLNQEIQIFSEQLSKRVVELFIPADRGAIWRSALLPGWGQVYKGRKTAGYIYGGAVGTGFAFSLFSLVMWQTSYSRYRNYDPDHVITPQGGTELIDPAESQAQFDRYASQVQTWQKITLISVGVTLVIYLWQIMDAWLFDSRYAELAKRTPTARSNGPSLILGGLVHDADQTNQVQNRMHGQLDFGLKISF